MTPENDLTPGEERRLGRVLDSWKPAPASRHLALSIMAAARPRARTRTPSFSLTWPRLATLAAAACLGLIVGWADIGEGQATSYDAADEALFFAGDAIEGDVL
jgi:hypothetical protein